MPSIRVYHHCRPTKEPMIGIFNLLILSLFWLLLFDMSIFAARALSVRPVCIDCSFSSSRQTDIRQPNLSENSENSAFSSRLTLQWKQWLGRCRSTETDPSFPVERRTRWSVNSWAVNGWPGNYLGTFIKMVPMGLIPPGYTVKDFVATFFEFIFEKNKFVYKRNGRKKFSIQHWTNHFCSVKSK